MLWIKKRKAKPQPVPVFSPPGTYHIVYEQRAQPDRGGARVYSYETLDLAQFPPSGPSVGVRQQWRTTNAALWSNPAVITQGIPIVAGQIYGQPLYDPNAGYTGPQPVTIPDNYVATNTPSSRPDPYAFRPNNPFPTQIAGAP